MHGHYATARLKRMIKEERAKSGKKKNAESAEAQKSKEPRFKSCSFNTKNYMFEYLLENNINSFFYTYYFILFITNILFIYIIFSEGFKKSLRHFVTGYTVQDWAFLTCLGVCAAFLSFFIDLFVEKSITGNSLLSFI